MFPPAAVNKPPEQRPTGSGPGQLLFDPGPEPPVDTMSQATGPRTPTNLILKFKRRKHMPRDLSMALTSNPDRFIGSAPLGPVSALKSPKVAGDHREKMTTQG